MFKFPLYGCSNENARGHAITLGLFALLNFGAYKMLQRKKSEQPVLKNTKYLVAFSSYLKQVDKLTSKVREGNFWLETNLSRETRENGLIIIEAYYGLDEHIY